MKRKRFNILLVLLLSINFLFANDDLVSKINSIKNCNDDYLYAESTSANWEEALNNAIYLLKIEVEVWAEEAGIDSVDGYFAKYHNKLVEIKTMRGSLYRAFVYLNKSDLIPYTNSDGLVVISGKTSIEQSLNETQSYMKIDDNTQLSQRNLSDIEKLMLNLEDASRIRNFVTGLKDWGMVEEYGRRQTINNCAECYVFVFNSAHKIVACLHKVESIYYNLQSGSIEDINRFSGCGALWFKLK